MATWGRVSRQGKFHLLMGQNGGIRDAGVFTRCGRYQLMREFQGKPSVWSEENCKICVREFTNEAQAAQKSTERP